ncbi:MAG: SDR family oxidoreductase [Euryarchaeota archaeon]|jgi:3-oxoacyl-[acyl-carrier protein] reductase|nr:SDR family oxidoreductase [Euryarchaeota archaeon]
MNNFKGKVAVVTGSGRGIGREIALAFSKEGANVIVNVKKRVDDGNETLRMVNEKSRGIMVQADVSTREGCKRLVEATIGEFGTVDILVNNAGTSIAMPFLESDDLLIEKTIKTNLLGPIYCSQEFCKFMKRGASIINISSLAGIKPMKYLSIYGITKFGIVGLTKYLALELSSLGIRVNAVAPSVVKTKMGDSLLSMLNISDEEYGKKYTLTGKIIEPREVADAVLFLAKNESITGEVIVIDSGQMLIDPFTGELL